MPINELLLEVHAYDGPGYRPLIDYGEWRVAVLRWDADMLPENIERFQRHHETDEVFVLLTGKCILFIGEGEDNLTHIHAEALRPNHLYNVKRNTWHFHTLSEDAVVLIVENRDTSLANSSDIALTPQDRARLIELTRSLWGDVKDWG